MPLIRWPDLHRTDLLRQARTKIEANQLVQRLEVDEKKDADNAEQIRRRYVDTRHDIEVTYVTASNSDDGGPDPDDVLDETYTDEGGAFYVTGTERELTNIDPVVKIYHDCDDGILPGQRKVKFYIPDTYIYSGSKARHAFNLGYLNLETIFPGEERDFL
ncbi:Transthyretin-like family protein [Oesophagostomum dentatum]|uniref:Transthyretin-like family protein n=1 Tax=Oesophagostomum dentatum TaxID=61180 RepID=A0A0B1TCD8_OESDE|nr:Transthyretin-like family protein [Oesophagostomum dentatum]